MLRFLFRKVLEIDIPAKDPATLVFSPQTNSYLKSISNLSCSTVQSSFTLSYLIKSCGLSPESALSASKKVTFKSAQQPDSVLSLLKNVGFSQTHISEIISKRPKILSSNANKTFKPKVDFFNELGVSGSALVMVLISEPKLLFMNLKNHIIPSVDFLKTLVHTNENVLLTIRRFPGILEYHSQTRIKASISILRDIGVPEANISKYIMADPRSLMLCPDRLRENLEIIKEIGFDQETPNFTLAVRVMGSLSKLNWDRKMEVYQSLGWSEDECLSAFRLQPMCMSTSEEKIRKVFNFLVNEFGWKPSMISKCPNLVLFSVDRRIVPRCSVVRVLMSKGTVRKDLNIYTVLQYTESSFVEKFVTKYQDEIPEVLNAYQGGVRLGLEEEGQSYNS